MRSFKVEVERKLIPRTKTYEIEAESEQEAIELAALKASAEDTEDESFLEDLDYKTSVTEELTQATLIWGDVRDDMIKHLEECQCVDQMCCYIEALYGLDLGRVDYDINIERFTIQNLQLADMPESFRQIVQHESKENKNDHIS